MLFVPCVNSAFVVIAQWHPSVVWLDRTLLILPSPGGHLGHFQGGAVMDNSAVNIHTQCMAGYRCSFFMGKFLGVE